MIILNSLLFAITMGKNLALEVVVTSISTFWLLSMTYDEMPVKKEVLNAIFFMVAVWSAKSILLMVINWF